MLSLYEKAINFDPRNIKVHINKGLADHIS